MFNTKLTQRDITLLHDLYAHSFLSFEQIKRDHFKKCASSTVYNRLSKLIKAKFVASMNVNIKATYLTPKDIGVIYFVTKVGLARLKDYWDRDIDRYVPVPVNLSTLYHDLLLTDVIKRLQGEFNCRVVNSKVATKEELSCPQVPDAILYHPKSKTKWAIELELTAKSNQRYREITSNYATSNFYERVLYLVKDESIHKKMGGIISGYGGQFKTCDDTGKFKFLALKEFLAHQKKEVSCEL